MKKYTKWGLIALIFAGCSSPQVEEPPFVKKPEPTVPPVTTNYVEVFTDQQYEKAKNGLASLKTVEYYGAVWCGYCKEQTPIIKELAAKHKNVGFIKIDVDGCKEAAASHGIRSLPTVIVGNEKFVGLTQRETLEKEIKK